MGAYNIYAGVQLKCEPEHKLCCESFELCDQVNLQDGIYAGYEGFVVILNGKLTAKFSYLCDKWGNDIYAGEVIDSNNPVNQCIDKSVKKHKKGDSNA